jgi:hypothetical protein
MVEVGDRVLAESEKVTGHAQRCGWSAAVPGDLVVRRQLQQLRPSGEWTSVPAGLAGSRRWDPLGWGLAKQPDRVRTGDQHASRVQDLHPGEQRGGGVEGHRLCPGREVAGWKAA